MVQPAVSAAPCRLLAEAGHTLHLVAREKVRLQSLARELDATCTVADVLEPDAFERVTQGSGDVLAGLAYAVGTLNLKPISRLTPEDIERDFRVNALGAVRSIQAALPALKASDGRASIVLFSSVAARRGFPLHASIGMAKAAVEGLVSALAAELAPSIRINAIAPSLTETPLVQDIVDNTRLRESIAAMHPLARLGLAEDVAALAGFLLSAEADWITGQVIGVDGGRGGVAGK